MKRWILGFLVVTLLLLLGAFFLGMTMQERITLRNYPATQLVDLISSVNGRPTQPAAWQGGTEATPIAVPVFSSQPAPPPSLPPTPPTPVSDFAPPPSTQLRAPGAWLPAPSNNAIPPSMVAQQRVRFPPSPSAAVTNERPNVVDLADSMSYLIDVSHKDKSQIRKIQSQRIHGGKQVIISDVHFVFGNQHLPDFRVFAEDVDVTSVDDEFELTCKGKVVVVANQSMLRGEGLELKDGVFKVAKAEVVTADAVIKAGDSEFEFAVGGISVNRLANNEDEVAEDQKAPADVGAVLGTASAPAYLPSGLPETGPPGLPSLPPELDTGLEPRVEPTP